MTVSVDFSTVASAVAGLSVPGVTMRDINQISSSYLTKPALLSPRPERYITDVSIVADTFGSGSIRSMTLRYKLNYVYYHCQIGSALDFAEYQDMINNVANIVEVLITNDNLAGATDNIPPTISDISAVSDPAGNLYLGCIITLSIVQYIN